MKVIKLSVVLSFVVLPFIGNAQEEKKEFGIKFSGFVKNDFFYDSRQNSTIREGHFLLFPLGENLDANKKDINAQPSFNILAIQSRLKGVISAPDAFGAKTSGVIEADFFGNESTGLADVNGFRLRHAYAKLNWTKTELLFGQYWHPMFIPNCFSGVISFNTGAPFQPFSRNPQIRVVHKIGKISITGALTAQRDFTSPGGSLLLRNSAIPEFNALLQYESKNETTKEEILAGIGGGYKTLKPLLNTDKGTKKYVADEVVSGFSATAFLKQKCSKATCKLQVMYGQNLFDLTMLGGYAVKKILDTNTNAVSYTSLNNVSMWAEFNTNGEKIQFGIWGGCTRNLGSVNSIAIYSNKVGGIDATIRGGDIKSIYRISPRVVFISGKFNFAVECEYTTAAYATKNTNTNLLNRDPYGVVTDAKNFSNLRVLFAAILNF